MDTFQRTSKEDWLLSCMLSAQDSEKKTRPQKFKPNALKRSSLLSPRVHVPVQQHVHDLYC